MIIRVDIRKKLNLILTNPELFIIYRTCYHHFWCSCYRTVPSAIWEIFSEFLMFCNLLLNTCLNKMYQELSYLLIVSGLFNIIWCYIGTNQQKERLQVLTLAGYVLFCLTALYFHISTRIFHNLFICFVYDSLFCNRFVFECFGANIRLLLTRT